MKLHRFTGAAVCIAAVAACHRAPAQSQTKKALERSAPQIMNHLNSTLSSSAPTPFEGEIQLEVTHPKEAAPLAFTYQIKADKLRYEQKQSASAAPATMQTVADLDQHKAYELLDAKKTYVEVDTTTAGLQTIPAQLKTSGKAETVAGMACDDLEITDGDDKLDVCAAKGIPYFDLSGRAKGSGEEPAWAAELTKAKEFPLRVVVHDKSGKETMRVEAKSVASKKLDDTLFAPPSDFRKEAPPKNLQLAGIP